MPVVAAIDIGTNTTRLLVSDGTRDIARRAIITRLGEGVDRSRVLGAAGIDRTISVLREYRSVLDTESVAHVRAIATSACRDATNRDLFLDSAEEALGFRPEVIGGDEEGALAFSGATLGLPRDLGPFCVVDIGGGSTEFILGTERVDGLISVDIGSVRLTETELSSDPPRPEELANALAIVGVHLDDVFLTLPAIDEVRTIIGVAGTITTVAAVELGLATYDRDRVHRFRLTRAAAEDVFRTLATERLADRVHNPGLEPARADVIVGGCCILVAILRRLDASEIIVSDADTLDGVVAGLLARQPPGPSALGKVGGP